MARLWQCLSGRPETGSTALSGSVFCLERKTRHCSRCFVHETPGQLSGPCFSVWLSSPLLCAHAAGQEAQGCGSS